MRIPILFKQSSLAALAVAMLFSASCVWGTNASHPDARTAQAADLFKQGKVQEALDLEEQAVKEKPKDWLAHAALSYFRWREGNVMDAVSEGQKAAQLAPGNEIVNTNLGHMGLALGDYQDATPAFEQAKKVAPSDWVPWVGLARCYIIGGHIDNALALLREMATQKSNSFDWHYQMGETYLKIEQPKLAAEAAVKAHSLASTPEQRSASAVQLLLALLRDNQLDRAKEIMNEVFTKIHPTDNELYVRVASALLPAGDPVAGKEFLQFALTNLKDKEDADGFFRLGTIFADKAGEVSHDATKCDAWIEYAKTAYEQAIALNPEEASYHLALAGCLNRQGKMPEMAEELTKMQTLDKLDPFAPYLVSRIQAAANHSAQNVTSGLKSSSHQPLSLNLTKVAFNIKGINCSCKISRIIEALWGVKGVALVVIPLQSPYRGTMLLDVSATPIDDVLMSQANEKRQAANPSLKLLPPTASFEVVSRQPLTSADEAIKLALTRQHGDVLLFYHQFDQVQPIMPVISIGTTDGTTTFVSGSK